jgi:hypothetical protein
VEAPLVSSWCYSGPLPASAELDRAAQAVTRLWLGLWLWPFSGGRVPQQRVEQRAEIRENLWRLRRAYSELVGEQGLDELIRSLAAVTPEPKELQRALVVWIDFLEVLIQDAERHFGSTRGLGAYKAQQVKAAMLRIVLASRLDIPRVPAVLEPFAVEIAVDWSIDTVVDLLNRHQLWQPGPPAGALRPSFLDRLTAWLSAPLRWCERWLELAARRLVLARHPLSPFVRSAVQAVEREPLFQPKVMAGNAVRLLRWLGEHGQQVTALVEIVAEAAHIAEEFADLEGPEKKQFVIDLVLAALEDLGFLRPAAGLSHPFFEWLLDESIEVVVHLFRKRGHFRGAPVYPHLDHLRTP